MAPIPVHDRAGLSPGCKAALLAACALAWTPVAHAQDKPATGVSFVDTFDHLNTKRWYVSDGWTNGDHQNCKWSRNEIRIDTPAGLDMGYSPKAAGADMSTCAEVQTTEVYSYGTYEARMKTPRASGLNAAFFSHIGAYEKKRHDEIDFEVLIKDPSKVQAGGFVDGKGVPAALLTLPIPADQGLIDYAFIWQPDSIRYYINGQLVHTVASPTPIQVEPQHIYFSLWSSDKLTGWMGPYQPPANRIAMTVERAAYTALGEPCQFPQSIVCQVKPTKP